MKHLVEGVPTLSEWLGELVTRKKISLARLAKMTGLTPQQVQRWLSDREQISRIYVAQIAQQVAPDEFNYALRLKDCEDFADRLVRQLERVNECAGDQVVTSALMFERAESLLAHEMGLAPSERADVLARYLTDAHFAAQAWYDCLSMDDLLSPAGVANHLRYPVNHFVGLMLDSPQLRPVGLDNLRALAGMSRPQSRQWRSKRRRNPADPLIRQHAIHLLARHGDPQDREAVKAVLRNAENSADAMAKRLGFVGLILVEGSPDTVNQYIAELHRNDELAWVNRQFDALHYGDVTLNEQGEVPSNNRQFNRAIQQIIRHLEHPEAYSNILPLELLKLTHILDEVGPGPFMASLVIERLYNARFHLHEPEKPIDGLDYVQKDFDKKFGQLLDVSSSREAASRKPLRGSKLA